MGIILPYKGDGLVAVIPRRAFFSSSLPDFEESKRKGAWMGEPDILQPTSFESARLLALKGATIDLKGFSNA